jgi:hypothetical protein
MRVIEALARTSRDGVRDPHLAAIAAGRYCR